MSGEILGGRDERVEWEDVFGLPGTGPREGVAMQEEGEGRVGMGKW